MKEKAIRAIRDFLKEYYPYLIFPFVFLGLSVFFSGALFLVELGLFTGMVLLLWFLRIRRKRGVREGLQTIAEGLQTMHRETLSSLPLPVMVVNGKGTLVWFSDKFYEEVLGKEDVQADFYNSLIHIPPVKLMESEIVEASHKGKHYSVFAMYNDTAESELYTLYFFDISAMKTLRSQYESTRPIVSLVVFDNRDDLMQGSADSVSARAVADVERILESWCDKYGGMLRRLKNDRFLVIMERAMLDKAIQNRFEILEQVRELKLGEKSCASLSIGVGKSKNGIRESAEWAKQALDMALGRGGDQAVIKSDDSFKFFGGVSKGVEKRNQVRTRVVATALCELIRDCDQVMLMGHRFADLDCVGSCIGMWSAVTKGLKKQAFLVVDRETSMAESLLNIFLEESPGMVLSPEEAILRATSKTLLIITDTHSPDFLECFALYERCQKVVVIDHHRMMVRYIEDAVIFYQEPFASSASELVSELIEYFPGLSLSRLEANAMLLGIILDTKNFCQRTGARTFEAAAALKRRGADTVEVKKLFSSTFEAYKLKSQIVSEAQIFGHSAIAMTHHQSSDLRIAAAQAADDLLGVEGVEASYVLFESEGEVNISARSYGEVNVQLVMEEIGGGGHQTMAGAQLKGTTPEQVGKRLLAIIQDRK